MASAQDAVRFHRDMEVVVTACLQRLLERVLRARPTTPRDVLQVVHDEAARGLKATAPGAPGWMCGTCGQDNAAGAAACASCGALREAAPGGGRAPAGTPLMTTLLETVRAREAAVAEREQELAAAAPKAAAPVVAAGTAHVQAGHSRFGDGVVGDAQGRRQDKVPEVPKVLPARYRVPPCARSSDGRAVLEHLAAWVDVKGAPIWAPQTVADLVDDAAFLVKHDRERTGARTHSAALTVRVMYAYTHSQLGPPVHWATWIPAAADPATRPAPARYEVLYGAPLLAHLEDSYARGADAVTTCPVDDALGGLLAAGGRPRPAGGAVWRAQHLVTYARIGLSVYGITPPQAPAAAAGAPAAPAYLVRYANGARGDRVYSPLSDAVGYLPDPAALVGAGALFHDAPEESVLPYPGVLEYVAASPAKRPLVGGARRKGSGAAPPPPWSTHPLEWAALDEFHTLCMEVPNQQKPDKGLHAHALRLVASADQAPPPPGFPKIPKKLFEDVFRRSVEPHPGAVLSPETLARALCLQCLTWHGRPYLVSLATTTAESRHPHTLGCVATGRVYSVHRTVHQLWPAQIFYLMNLSMRETQWGHHAAKLSIPFSPTGNGLCGSYYAPQPSDEAVADGAVGAAAFAAPDAGLFGTLHQKRLQWDPAAGAWHVAFPGGRRAHVPAAAGARVELKAWLLPQCRPLVHYMNAALAALRGRDAGAVQKTYRGLKTKLSIDEYAAGNVLVWAQYSSTSVDQGVAASFASGTADAAVFTLRGTSCVPVAGYSRFAREAEVLYPMNACFHITESLTKEQAQLLGKEHVQLFTLEEVTEVEMHTVLVRRLLPFARTIAAASVVFQAERALLKSDQRLDMSLSDPTDGEIPSTWQMLVRNASVNCPALVRSLSRWQTAASEWGDALAAESRQVPPVPPGHPPGVRVYRADCPDGHPGTAGLRSIMLSHPLIRSAEGTYRRPQNDPDSTTFQLGQARDITVSFDAAASAWRWRHGNENYPDAVFTSFNLLGEWPASDGVPGPTLKPGIVKPVPLAPLRCPAGHAVVRAENAAAQPPTCGHCQNAINDAHYLRCTKCAHVFVHTSCGDQVRWAVDDPWMGSAEHCLSLEANALVLYGGQNAILAPAINRVHWMGDAFADQNDSRAPLPEGNQTFAFRRQFARLCMYAMVPHNIPLACPPALPPQQVLKACNALLANGLAAGGGGDDAPPALVCSALLLGAVSGPAAAAPERDPAAVLGASGRRGSLESHRAREDRAPQPRDADSVHLKIAGGACVGWTKRAGADAEAPLWVADLHLRRSAQRPGLAVGDAGACMIAEIIKLGVPLRAVGLRYNRVSVTGARALLAAVKTNTHVTELLLQDRASTPLISPLPVNPAARLSFPELEAAATLDDVVAAITLRCAYHKVLLDGDGAELDDEHIAVSGAAWPAVVALGLGDVPNLRLPLASALHAHPNGWNALLKLLPPRSGTQPTARTLQAACTSGLVRGIAPLLAAYNTAVMTPAAAGHLDAPAPAPAPPDDQLAEHLTLLPQALIRAAAQPRF